MPEIICSEMVHLGQSLRAAYGYCSLTAFGSSSDYEARNSVSRLQQRIAQHRENCIVCSRLKPAATSRPAPFLSKKSPMPETILGSRIPQRRSA